MESVISTGAKSILSKSDIINPNDVSIKLITDWEEFVSLKSEWNNLLSQSDINRVFLTHEWFQAWFKAFGSTSNLFILLARYKDNLLGVAPFLIKRSLFRGFPVNSIEFMSNNDSPACGFIYKNGYDYIVELFINYLINEVKQWGIIILKNLVNKNIISLLKTSLLNSNFRYLFRPGLKSPYLLISTDWGNYYKGLSSKRRKTLRNISNRIKRLGEIKIMKFTHLTNLNDLVEITKKAWKFREGKSFLNKVARKCFFENLTTLASSKNWLSVWILYNKSKPIAYEYHLNYNGTAVALLSEYNEDYKKYSPGAYLDYEIIKSYFNDNFYEYDMAGSADDYKKKWTKLTRNYTTMIVFNKNCNGIICYFLEYTFKMLRKSKHVLFKYNR